MKAFAIPYHGGDLNVTHTNALATSYNATATTLTLPGKTITIDNFTNPHRLERLLCGIFDASIGFFVLLPLSMILLFLAGWSIIRKPTKHRDEESSVAMEQPPRLDQYQSASKLRLKEKVRAASPPKAASQRLGPVLEDFVDGRQDTLSTPYGPSWRAAKLEPNEKREDSDHVIAKDLPHGADVFTATATPTPIP